MSKLPTVQRAVQRSPLCSYHVASLFNGKKPVSEVPLQLLTRARLPSTTSTRPPLHSQPQHQPILCGPCAHQQTHAVQLPAR